MEEINPVNPQPPRISHEPPPSEPGAALSYLIGILALFGLGVMAGFVLSESGAVPELLDWSRAGEYDGNDDGKTDLWQTSRQGQVVSTARDFNFDGVPDYWESYENGWVVSARSDVDFDGVVDSWMSYQGGMLSRGRFDVDGDGVADTTYEYSDGLPVAGLWHPRGGIPVRRTEFEAGILRRIWRTNENGENLELTDQFDPYMKRVSE